MSSSVAAYMHIPTTVRTWRVGAGRLPCAATVWDTRRERRRGGGGGGGSSSARAARATDGRSSDRWRGRCSVCATRRLGRGAVGGAAERHASPLEPQTAHPPRRDGRSRSRPVRARPTPPLAPPRPPLRGAPVRCAPARAPIAKSRRLSAAHASSERLSAAESCQNVAAGRASGGRLAAWRCAPALRAIQTKERKKTDNPREGWARRSKSFLRRLKIRLVLAPAETIRAP